MESEPTSGVWREIRADLGASGRAFITSFASRDLGPLQLAYIPFNLTEWGAFIALLVFAYQIGGTGAVGLVALGQQIPAAVVASFGSVLADRFDRRRVLIGVLLLLAVMTTLAGAAMLLDAPSWLAVLLGCAAGWALTLVRPTYSALLPWVVHSPKELTQSYAASGLIESMCIFLGPLVTGLTLGIGTAAGVSGPGLAFVTFGVLSLLGTLAATFTRISNARVEDDEGEEEDESFRLRELLAGFRYVASDGRRSILVGLIGGSMLLLGMMDSIAVVLAINVLHRGESGVGFLNAAVGVGAVVGATAAMVVTQRARLFPSFRAGLIGSGLPLAATALVPVLAAPMFAVSGGGMQLLDVTGRTMLQRIVPDEKLARVFGVLESLYMGAEGVGAFAGSILIAAIGTRWSLVVASVLLPAAGFALRSRLAALDVGMRVPTAEMALLRRTDLFGPLTPQALERLARNLVPVDVPAGETVIREGEPGSRFYVIELGSAVVTRAGSVVVERGVGDYFGEVALLYDQPRNATVTAVTDLRVLVLERDEFLRTVTGTEGVALAARRVAADRSLTTDD